MDKIEELMDLYARLDACQSISESQEVLHQMAHFYDLLSTQQKKEYGGEMTKLIVARIDVAIEKKRQECVQMKIEYQGQ